MRLPWALTCVLLTACAGGGPDETATFDLPTELAATYDTAYIAGAAPGGDHAGGEHVVIANNASIRIDLGGWAVLDEDGIRLPLGIGRQIEVGAELRLYTGCGEETDDAVYACVQREDVLGDAGELLRLVDAGGTEVARFDYGP